MLSAPVLDGPGPIPPVPDVGSLASIICKEGHEAEVMDSEGMLPSSDSSNGNPVYSQGPRCTELHGFALEILRRHGRCGPGQAETAY
jgi:hypothetical protein